MHKILSKLSKNKAVETPRENHRVYVLTGETGINFGDLITWNRYPKADDNSGEVMGWVGERPVRGDVILSKMRSGEWGVYIVQSSKGVGDPHDMFYAEVKGCFGYAVSKINGFRASERLRKPTELVLA